MAGFQDLSQGGSSALRVPKGTHDGVLARLYCGLITLFLISFFRKPLLGWQGKNQSSITFTFATTASKQ
jgi:hypothetical protein